MELKEAKNIVRQLKGKSFIEIIKESDYLNIAEAIRMVSEASTLDQESYAILDYIPAELQYAGLYPHVMQSFNITPEIFKNECI